jgi:cytochrome c-type biogenesis protein CcmE
MPRLSDHAQEWDTGSGVSERTGKKSPLREVSSGGSQMMEQTLSPKAGMASRMKFIVGGLLIIAAVVYLIVSSTKANAQYFLTINELATKGNETAGRDIRVSGAVIGDTIKYDPKTLTLTFTVAHVPGDNKEIDAQGGLAAVLHAAVIDPSRTRLQVVYKGVKPDLLRNEAQAIMTGKLGSDGVFYANELLLKCPTKYQDAVPGQVKN